MRNIMIARPLPPVITLPPVDQANYDGGAVTFTIGASATNPTYQWQENTGSGFSNISNGGNYSGATSIALTISNVTFSMYDYQYRCIVSSDHGPTTSTTANLKVVKYVAHTDISQNPWAQDLKSGKALKMINTTGFEYYKVNLGTALGGSTRYEGSVVGPNKIHYGIPHTATNVLRIDLDTMGITTIGSLPVGGSKYVGGALAHTGNIYGCPHNATTVLKINTTTDVVSTFDSLSAATTKWAGCAAAWTGKIYCAPFDATTILVIDPDTDTTYQIANSGGILTGSNKWVGILPGADGRLYCIPYNATYVLVIDPTNDTYTTIGSLSASTNKWSGGDISWTDNGLIFCCPYSATTVLVIDTVHGTTSEIGSGIVPAGTGKWESIKNTANGLMYTEQLNESRILRIDTSLGATDAAVSLIDGFGGTSGWVGQNLSHLGSLIGMPYSATRPYRFILANTILDSGAYLNIFNNHY